MYACMVIPYRPNLQIIDPPNIYCCNRYLGPNATANIKILIPTDFSGNTVLFQVCGLEGTLGEIESSNRGYQ